MNRRAFLGGVVASLLAAAKSAAQADGWRTFEVTTRVDLPAGAGLTRAWLPLASAALPECQRVVRQSWKGNAPVLRALRDEKTRTGILFAEWPEGDPQPRVELTLTVATRDRVVNWGDLAPRGAPREALQRYRRPTALAPLDGAMRETVRRLTLAEPDEVTKARAIYEWIVERAGREPSTPDPNVLFVALARTVGVPARVVNGLRVSTSRMFASLGRSGDVTTAQHCRAQFHSARHGWVPVDPAGVRTVMVEEPGGRDFGRHDVAYARRQLFGAWEMNWIAFNDAENVALPQSPGRPLPILMHPHAEQAGRRLDSLAPETFRYRITARQL